MTYVTFAKLTDDQQFALKLMHPDWGLEMFRQFEYRLTKRGTLSRKKGDHRPTEQYGRELDRMLRTPIVSSATSAPTPTKDQPVRRTGIQAMHLGSNKD